ncbi:hypothetical protein AB0L06_43125 [Spirillospora sp. NPDC052269]
MVVSWWWTVVERPVVRGSAVCGTWRAVMDGTMWPAEQRSRRPAWFVSVTREAVPPDVSPVAVQFRLLG